MSMYYNIREICSNLNDQFVDLSISYITIQNLMYHKRLSELVSIILFILLQF